MSMITALNHVTHYTYDKPVTLGMQTVRLRPAPHAKARIQSYSLHVEPKDHYINWQQDPFGNFLARIMFNEKVTEFKIEVDVITDMQVFNPFDFFLEEYAKEFPFTYETDIKDELVPYLELKEKGKGLTAWVESIDKTPGCMIDFLVKANQKVMADFDYILRMEPGVQTCEETADKKSGSCRDMAWFLCQALRHVGLATRFASGYLIQLAPDVKSLDGPSGTEIDFTDLHAWTEVFLPGAGWVGLDPTSGLFTGEGHIPLCCTPNPSGAAPVSGTLEMGAEADLDHSMSITRIAEPPRVTKPYTDDQWTAIDALGAVVDTALDTQDVRLTMGGEPTFVSLDDREGDSWHYAALGDNKKPLAKDMLQRMRHQFAPGGLTMHTQGKWYPGEILPRWAMPCFWRKDNIPLWNNAALQADPDNDLGHSFATSEMFLKAVSEQLAIPSSYVIPAREDTPYYLWKERRLPLENVMMEADLFEEKERARLQNLVEGDLNAPVGYVLPLHFSHIRKRWISNAWTFKSPHMVLMTGDSPMGMRLPLASLPYPAEALNENYCDASPFEMATPLPTRETLSSTLSSYGKPDDSTFLDDANGLIRTALCAEVRNGILHVFMPPCYRTEHALELITAMEHVAESHNIPFVLEGYTPPNDIRISYFSVTPDPGVIEINVQPAANWQELKHITKTVYAEAREARLSAEKFMLDGRRIGTGGGNHIVMGAATPDDSPFLRRPDVLRSLITFWQNHPALSYVFAGMYIGPTSQAPRIDEARHDSLYELEIAFSQIPPAGGYIAPWMVDRLCRNLLVDITGNTHRAEFCIDKLYSPDSERGRLGLLEMRGFEMTPHPKMNLVQNLLIRACVAHFWHTPYTGKLMRWGTQLHDKFMLPHHLRQDMADVLHILRAGGFDLKDDWFDPFFAFRFPECGIVCIGDMTIDVRTALEPWPVMGEEPAGGGVSRSVDSTVERVQVKTTGLMESRHILTCNGRRVPLKQTNTQGEQVAGVRFKAWSQPSSLHPNLLPNVPLTFDIVDVQQSRSLGGCCYHVAHPGGLNDDRFPVTENEAEGRRLSHFEPMGHTPGHMFIPSVEDNPEFPHTLDLRRAF